MLERFVAPLGLAILFSALMSLGYMYVHRHEADVQKNSLILFGILFVFIGIRLLLPH